MEIEDRRAWAATLLACSLTCRQWFSRAQLHLQSCANIASRSELDQWQDLSRQTLSRNVYVLRIDARSCAHLVPLYLAKWLPALRQVEFHHSGLTRAHHSFPMLLSQFTSVTTLLLSFTLFTSFKDLTRCIQGFPNLSGLQMYHVEILHDHPFKVPVPRKKLRLQWLRLAGTDNQSPYIPEFIAWLCACICPSSLRSLRIGFVPDITDPQMTNTVCSTFGSSLQELTVGDNGTILQSLGRCNGLLSFLSF